MLGVDFNANKNWKPITIAKPASKYPNQLNPFVGFLKSLTIPAQNGHTDLVGVPS